MVWWGFGCAGGSKDPEWVLTSAPHAIHMEKHHILVLVGWLMLTTVWSLPLRVALCLTK